MNIPNFLDIPVIKKDGTFTDEWRNIMQQLIQQLQLNASNEGIVIPSQSTANKLIIQNGLNPDGTSISQSGQLLFVNDVQNGGTPQNPNGQLFVKLQDGTFHPITNT